MKKNSKEIRDLDKLVDLKDKKISSRHEAKFVLIAHVRYVYESGKQYDSKDIVVGRCFTKNEAKKFMNDITRTETAKHTGFDENGATYKMVLAKSPNLSYINSEGRIIYEIIDRFSIEVKTDYFNNRR